MLKLSLLHVMKEKIKQAIKTAHKDLTLSAQRMDVLADKLSKVITNETDIEATVSSYDFEPYYELAKSDDKVRNLENQKPKPQPQDREEQKPAGTDNLAELIAKAVSDAVTPLQNKLEGFEKTKTIETFREQLSNELKDAPDYLKTAYLGQLNDSTTQESFDNILSTAKQGVEAFKADQPKQGGILVAKQNNGKTEVAKADDPVLAQFGKL